MGKKILQINFHYTADDKDLLNGSNEFAKPISETAGLIWKIWIYNEKDKISGGIYLFADDTSAQNYLKGPVGDHLRSNPGFENLDIKIFNMMDGPNKLTRAPV